LVSILYNQENDVIELDAVNEDPNFNYLLDSVINDFKFASNATPLRVVIVLIEENVMKFRLYDQLEAFLKQLTEKNILIESGQKYIDEWARQYDAEPNDHTFVGKQHILWKFRREDEGIYWQFSVVDSS